MANEAAGAGDGATGPEVVLALQNVYLKDCSYESPNGPRMEGNWNPQINLDLQTGSTSLGPELREVVLTVTVSAKYGEATIFLVEVKQAGLFVIRNLSEEDTKRAVGTYCPGRAVPLRARGDLQPRHAGRLPAVPAAAGQLRRPVRGQPAAADAGDHELGTRRTADP